MHKREALQIQACKQLSCQGTLCAGALAPPSLSYFPQPAWMAWQDWKKPGKVMLFDSDARFNYVLAFISK